MKPASCWVGLVLAAAAGDTACGQAGWLFTPIHGPGQNSVNPRFPSVTIRVSAFFPSNDYALAGARWDMVAADSTWQLVGLHGVLPPFGGGGNPPIIRGTTLSGCMADQLNFPQGGIFADPRNPIPAFETRWVTGDFRPRFVEIATRTTRFDVYVERSSPRSESRLSVLTEAGVRVRVTPAPGCGALALGAAMLAGRRRREA